MKRLSQLRISWLFIVIVSFFVACSSPQGNIVGKWAEKTSGMEAMEFFKDKTFTMNEGSKKAVFTGKWSMLDDGRIKVDLMAYGGTAVFFFILVGDELEMDMNGKKGRLIRIK